MKTGTGAKFACEAGIDPAGNVGAARHIDKAKFVREVGIRLLQPIEVIGDREVLGHVALPGRHRATIGLGPMRHDAISILARGPPAAGRNLVPGIGELSLGDGGQTRSPPPTWPP